MWLDNQPVTAISSNCQPETGTITRKQRDGSQIELQCPSAIMSYSKYMGGVDTHTVKYKVLSGHLGVKYFISC